MKIWKILGLLAVTTAQNSTEITTTISPSRALSKLKNVVDTMTTWIEIELIEYKEDFQKSTYARYLVYWFPKKVFENLLKQKDRIRRLIFRTAEKVANNLATGCPEPKRPSIEEELMVLNFNFK